MKLDDALQLLYLLVIPLAAIGSLVVAIISLCNSRAVREQQARLQAAQEELAGVQIQLHKQQLEAIERETSAVAKADVRVSLEGNAPQAKFKIHNWGLGPASNIRIDIRSQAGRDEPIISSESKGKLPIPRLAPGASVGLSTYLTWGTGTIFDVQWSWENDDGTTSEERSTISL